MLTAGIDIGAKNIKVVILKDDQKILARTSVPGGIDQKASAEEALKSALQKAKAKRSDLEHIVSTGVGRKAAPYITRDVFGNSRCCQRCTFPCPHCQGGR